MSNKGGMTVSHLKVDEVERLGLKKIEKKTKPLSGLAAEFEKNKSNTIHGPMDPPKPEDILTTGFSAPGIEIPPMPRQPVQPKEQEKECDMIT